MIAHCTNQAEGAIKNGSRIEKCNTAGDDAHPDGSLGTVLGSLGPVNVDGLNGYLYCVEWDDRPGLPVFVSSPRIKEVLRQ